MIGLAFWIQFHHLPLGSLNMHIASDIVFSAGTVILGSGDTEEFEGGNYMRVHVSIDFTKPLSRGRKVVFENGEESWVSFKYERLPNLCYWCGCLTHQDRDCSLWHNIKGSLSARNQLFGPWLRAGTSNLAKRTIVKVVGYEEDVKGDVEQTSPIRMQERQGRTKVQLDQRTVTMDQQRVQSNRDEQADLVVVQEVRTEVDMDPGHGSETNLTACTSSQSF